MRKRIRLLKYHADLAPEREDIDATPINRFALAKANRSRDPAGRDEVREAVQGMKKTAFPASGRADESGHGTGFDLEIHVFDRFEVPVGY